MRNALRALFRSPKPSRQQDAKGGAAAFSSRRVLSHQLDRNGNTKLQGSPTNWRRPITLEPESPEDPHRRDWPGDAAAAGSSADFHAGTPTPGNSSSLLPAKPRPHGPCGLTSIFGMMRFDSTDADRLTLDGGRSSSGSTRIVPCPGRRFFSTLGFLRPQTPNGFTPIRARALKRCAREPAGSEIRGSFNFKASPIVFSEFDVRLAPLRVTGALCPDPPGRCTRPRGPGLCGFPEPAFESIRVAYPLRGPPWLGPGGCAGDTAESAPIKLHCWRWSSRQTKGRRNCSRLEKPPGRWFEQDEAKRRPAAGGRSPTLRRAGWVPVSDSLRQRLLLMPGYARQTAPAHRTISKRCSICCVARFPRSKLGRAECCNGSDPLARQA